MYLRFPEAPRLEPAVIKENLALIDGLRETIILGGRKDEECASVLRFLCQQHKSQIHTTYPPTSLVLACVERVEGQNLTALISVLLNQAYTHFASTTPLDPRLIAQQMLMTSAALIAHDPTTLNAVRTEMEPSTLSYSMRFSLIKAHKSIRPHFKAQHSLIAEPLPRSQTNIQLRKNAATAVLTDNPWWECKSSGSTLQ